MLSVLSSKGENHICGYELLCHKDLPQTRIMIFGYESELLNSESFQNVRMLAGTLRSSIATIRSKDVCF
jgi:hypothetical protein